MIYACVLLKLVHTVSHLLWKCLCEKGFITKFAYSVFKQTEIDFDSNISVKPSYLKKIQIFKQIQVPLVLSLQ